MDGDAFGPYRLRASLGRGGMGEVWHALDTRKDREVALKVLGPWLAVDAAFAERFRRESALAARLNAPNIVPIHDYGEMDGRLFIDMQLVDGADLAAVLDRGPLPPPRAVGVVVQLAHALATAHAAGLVHRDVKPSNVLLVDGVDHAYLIDFGLAGDTGGSSAALGTPAYMAPERFSGGGDHRADVYALGCVLYQALTGHPPFPGTDPMVLMAAHLRKPAPRPSSRPGVPTAFDDVVARAMAKAPEDRFETATELGAAAERALRSRVVAPPVRRRRTAYLIVAAATVVAIVVTAVLLAGSAPTSSDALPDRTLTGHGDAVNGVAATVVNGRPAVVTASTDRTVRVWDAETGAPVGRPMLGHASQVWAVATTEIGGRPVAVSAGRDGTLRRWDATTGAALGEPMRLGEVGAVVAGRLDGRPVLAVDGRTVPVRILDPETGRPVGPGVGRPGYVGGMAFAELDGRSVLVIGDSTRRAVRAWDPVAGAAVGPAMTGPTAELGGVTVTLVDDRPVVFAGSADTTVWRWDLATGRALGPPVLGHGAPVYAVASGTSGGAPVAISADADGTVRVWDPGTGESIAPPGLPPGEPVLELATLTVGGRPTVVAAGFDRVVRIRDLDAWTGR